MLDLFGESETSGKKAEKVVDSSSGEESGSDSGNENEEDQVSSDDNKSEGEEFGNTEEVNAFRNKMQIKVKGNDIPKPCATFYTMDMPKDLKQIIIKNIEVSDWKEPTPIQMQGIPTLLAGRDVLAAAPTGSGKTAAL
jgi:ATP-dependent RNA helicase DDX52/ROK1